MFKNIVITYLLLLTPLLAQTLYFESGLKQNTLIELYTSEGCSSCPPAEEYLNNLTKDKELWTNLIPIAFHVDYWDYIGWRDLYATKKFGQRQSAYANLKHNSTVYTPAFIVNGSNWRRGIFSSALPEENTSSGNLIVSVSGNSVHATYPAIKKNSALLNLNIAVLGMGLTSQILRGENEGRTAKHEFVVVGFDSVNSNKSSKEIKNNKSQSNQFQSKEFQWDVKLPELHNSDAREYGLAIWISEITNPTPLQVVGGLLPSYKK